MSHNFKENRNAFKKYRNINTKEGYHNCTTVVKTVAETRADTKKTKAVARTTERRILRNIAGFTLRDTTRNSKLRAICNTQDIVSTRRLARNKTTHWKTSQAMERLLYIDIRRGSEIIGRKTKYSLKI